jgi:hypothetical protein
MLARVLRLFSVSNPGLAESKLFDQDTFYPAFLSDLKHCKSEVIIESPFITTRRINMLLPEFEKLRRRGVRIIINTRDPREHEDYLKLEAESSIAALQDLDVQILFTGGHHRKLAILDRTTLYEGSLNILSQNDSCEIMRRIKSRELTWQMYCFAGLDKL